MNPDHSKRRHAGVESDERITVHGGPDDKGRYEYTLEWWSDYTPGHPDGEYVLRWRGQVFFGPLPERFTHERT